jgi:surface protein
MKDGRKLVKPIYNVHKKYKEMHLVNPYRFGSSAFTSTWKTDNLSTGSSTSTQVKLPLIITGTYNFVVDWGDGSTSTITVWNQAQTTHTYSVAGTYTIKITGTCIGWRFNNTGDRLKLLTITSWGKLNLGSTEGEYFYGCSNLTLTAVSDALILTGTTSLRACFRGCTVITTINKIHEWNVSAVTIMDGLFASTNFNQSLSAWNVSSVTSFGNAGAGMFTSNTVFNQDLSNWNVSNSTSFINMFNGASAFNNGGSSSINNWTLKNTSTVNLSGMFTNAIIFNQPLSNWNTSKVNSTLGMFNSAYAFNQNIGTWDLSSCTDMSSMFKNATVFNNGGSSTINLWNTGNVTTMANMFERSISGTNVFNQLIGSWNTGNVTTMASMFESTTGLVSFNQNIGAWNVNKVGSFDAMFRWNRVFNNGSSSDINNWVLKSTGGAGAVILSNMFNNAQVFNQPIGNWDVSQCSNFSNMFTTALIFNQSLSSWNMTNATNLSGMFNSAHAFNQNIGAWNVSNVSNFSSMFFQSNSFNNGGSADINNWILKNTGTINMSGMFSNAIVFNQPIGNWNVSKVTNFNSFLGGTVAAARIFNQDLSLWDVSSCTDMGAMFGSTNGTSSFNNGGSPGINNWNVSNVISMSGMFSNNTAFNQPIGSWNTGNVISMNSMFYVATAFNQNISSWNTAKVTDMTSMFRSTIFNQNIGSWNVSLVTNFTNFMFAKTPATLSTANLDAIYNGWSTRPVKTPITINFGTAKYTAGASAGRAILTGAPNNWVITDGGI